MIFFINFLINKIYNKYIFNKMGTKGTKDSNVKLSPELEARVMAIFKKIDIDDSKSIDKEETLKLWFYN